MDKYYSKTDLLHFIRVKTRYLDDSIIANEGDDSARIKGYAHAFEHFENALTESCDDEIPKADVQPLSVVAEHIKNRLYETAYNTTEEKARNAIADMAGRIDIWIDELKGGDTNG